jgi:hypothetical protein
MTRTELLVAVDSEISVLRQVRALLADGDTRYSGRAAKPAVKRGISAAGRARIAAAQRARWAKLKAKKPSA